MRTKDSRPTDGRAWSWLARTFSVAAVMALTLVFCSGAWAVLTVTVNNPPPFCSGGSATVNAIVSSGTPPYTYSWSPSAGLNTTSGASVIASPTITTAYTVTVTDSSTPNVKAGQATSAVTVNTPPSISGQPQSQGVCAGSSVSFCRADVGFVTTTWQP